MSRNTTFTGRRIRPSDWKHHDSDRLTSEQVDFVRSAIERGLTDLEAARMFFRHFGRDIAHTTVGRYRRL